MTIPEARRRLMNLAAKLAPAEANELMEIIKDGLFRRTIIVPTRPKNKKVTKLITAQIRALHAKRPDLSQLEIGVKLGVNPGRVSEALIGKRT